MATNTPQHNFSARFGLTHTEHTRALTVLSKNFVSGMLLECAHHNKPGLPFELTYVGAPIKDGDREADHLCRIYNVDSMAKIPKNRLLSFSV